ncbi:hypothetical protein BDZ94DRAFT_1259625 [Collybia nuda]|uniref:Uncharacterized protein n=1 Tax=Collybia nuda TaxID=64659 RepID=A0A9P5Y6C9_9AGAR|nr:hypothetical protein BDZ94DRAFT_1259625 [Collybia nuda]
MTAIRAQAKSNQLKSDSEYLKSIKSYANESGSVRFLDVAAHRTKSAIVNQAVKKSMARIERPDPERIVLLGLYLDNVFLPSGTTITAELDKRAAQALQKMVGDIKDKDERVAAQAVLNDARWATKTSVTDLYKKALQIFDKNIKEWAPPKLDL